MAQGEDPILVLRDIKKTYEEDSDSSVTEWILNGIDLAVHQGEALSLVGPSGSGKSSLLNIIGALDQATEGEVRLEGQDLARMDEDSLAIFRNRKIGFIFQAHHLLPQCNVLENVQIPLLARPKKERPENIIERAVELLKRVGLGHRLRHLPGQLSGGEKQRVAVVRALINNPILLLADEPTGSLDRKAAENLIELLIELNTEERLTLIMVTHDQYLAQKLGRIESLEGGRLASQGARHAEP